MHPTTSYLGSVDVNPEGVGVAAVIEQEKGGEEAGPELDSFGRRDAGEGGVRDDATDLVEVVLDTLLNCKDNISNGGLSLAQSCSVRSLLPAEISPMSEQDDKHDRADCQ